MAQDSQLLGNWLQRRGLVVCEECSDANEAKKIAKHFEAIADSIKNQIGEQRGG